MKIIHKAVALLGVVGFIVAAFTLLASAPVSAGDKAPAPTPDAGVVDR